jgi:hypothetical protein
MVYVSCVVNDEPLVEALRAALRRLPAVQLRSLRFWPAVSLVSYGFVAPDKRALFANVASLIWSTYAYASFVKHKDGVVRCGALMSSRPRTVRGERALGAARTQHLVRGCLLNSWEAARSLL